MNCNQVDYMLYTYMIYNTFFEVTSRVTATSKEEKKHTI